uniref:class I histocompatibility antigen, F10 alpha chain-like n=1 Tax=Pristiophorus japonicus TaxID=55135 RepID=UPI00398EB8A6
MLLTDGLSEKDCLQTAHPSLSREVTMFGLTVLALLCGEVCAGSHSLRYMHTAITPLPGIAEFTDVGYVDDQQFIYYDSVSRQYTPRQRWIRESEGAEYWERYTQILRGKEQVMKGNIQTVLTRTNQTGGIHTLQRLCGCELRDDGTTSGFWQYGWDGKDLISFDKDRLVWVTPVPWGEITKNKWDQDRAEMQQDKSYLEQECIEWLKKYLKAGERELGAVAPQVFPSVDKASNIKAPQLSCLLTGFYPREIQVTLLRNGEPIRDTESTGILPNHDGTYQLTTWAQIEPADGATYSCQYEQSGQAGGKTRDWDGTFRVTPGSPEGTNRGLIVGIVIAAVALIALVIGAVVWKRRGGEETSGYSPANPAERGELSPNSAAQS